MRMVRRNKSKMKYALSVGATTIYERDENGDIVYTEVDGQQIPVEVGTIENSFSTPVDFEAVVTARMDEIHARQYGVDQTSVYSEISVLKGQIPLKYGSVIWKNNPVEWIDEPNGVPDPNSADYIVKGILDEYLDYDFYLLQRRV